MRVNLIHLFNMPLQLVHRPDVGRRLRLFALLVRMELLVELILLVPVVVLGLQVGPNAEVVECTGSCGSCDGHASGRAKASGRVSWWTV